MLSVKLFGPGEARFNECPLPGFPAQQPYHVLCYLLLNQSHVQVRENLATLFWPDYSHQAALKAMRNVLWRLRQMLQAAGVPPQKYLSVEEDRVAFFAVEAYSLDTEHFERVIHHIKGRPGKSLTTDEVDELEQAVSLYSGDLLEGILSDWCLVEREHLRTLYMNALSTLMAYYEAHANYERGLMHGESILSREPTREAVHRKMMRLYWLSGDRAAALMQYHHCEQILRDELGVGPMAQTQRLYQLMAHDHHLPHKPVGDRCHTPSEAFDTSAPAQPTLEKALQRVQQLQDELTRSATELDQLKHMLEDLNQ